MRERHPTLQYKYERSLLEECNLRPSGLSHSIVLKFEICQTGGHNSNPRSNVTSLNDLEVGGLPEVRGFMPKCEKKSLRPSRI